MNIDDILSGEGGSNLVAQSISDKIWGQAFDNSIVKSLTTEEPITMGTNIIPVQTGQPSAHIVGEGQPKRSTTIEYGAKSIKPRKAVVQVRISEEFVRLNPARALEKLNADFASAITRQIDVAVIYGKSADNDVTFSDAESISDTTNTIELPTDRTLIEAAIEDGEELLAASGHYANGWAFDPLGVTRLGRAANASGHKAFGELSSIGNPTNLSFFRGGNAAVARAVSGNVDGVTPTNTLAIAGNWDAVKLGYNSGLEFEKIEYGDPDNTGRDLKGNNEVVYRAEVFFGYAIMDPNAFVLFNKIA